MTKRSRVVLVLALAIFAPLVAQPAHAATPPPDYNELDHTSFHTYPVPDPSQYDDGFTALAADGRTGGCNKHHQGYQVDGYNSFGDILWSFGGYLQTCTRNGNVVHKRWGACWGWTSNDVRNLWNFKGCEIEDQSSQNLPRNYIWRQWRGHFKWCLVWRCKTKDPWVYIGGRGDGTFGTNGGAG